MALGWDRPAPPAQEAAIARVERELGIELPADYREFLGRQNGGEPEQNFYPPGEGFGRARYLYSAGPTDLEDIDDLVAEARRSWADPMTDPPEDPMDRSLLPIGEDAFANLICLKVSGGEDYGAVYFRDSDVPESPEAYTRLTDSFTEFFDALRPEEELDLS